YAAREAALRERQRRGEPAEPATEDEDGFTTGHSDPDPLDLPFELDAGILLHALADGFAQALDVGGGGVAGVDQKIAVHLRDLRVTDDEAAAAGGVHQLPSLVARWILEGRATGAALDRLRRLARLRDLVHLGGDLRGITGRALKQRLGENDVV